MSYSLVQAGCSGEKSGNLPEIDTTAITEISSTSAKSGGNITSSGTGDITARGVCWAEIENPVITDMTTNDGIGTGEFESQLTSLKAETKYYVRAFAKNNEGTSYGKELSFTTLSGSSGQSDQIIADHTVIERFDDIPPDYITQIKKMMIAFPGESHSAAYRKGMELLEALDAKHACNVGTAEAYTDQYVRVENYGWTGEYVFWIWHALSPRPSAWLKNDITAYKNAGHPFSALGFGWCNDMSTSDHISPGTDPVYGVHWYGRSELGPDGDQEWGLDAGDYSITGNRVSLETYFGAMEELITHCATNSPTTKMIFTTGPVDIPAGEWTGECGYQGHLKHEAIRNYVRANPTRILFDYADILCYSNDGTAGTQTWNGHTYPVITAANLGDESIGHIGSAGAIRLAKAQWWLLARLAGWDGK